MAQLPPSAVFGSSRPGQPVHVLLLIENSLPMVEHWQDLQHQILPGILGAVRIANPDVDVQVFWETTGKTQDKRSSNKPQRHFNDFPDIDIVGLPRNRLTPLFIRQSIDLFLSGNDSNLSVTRHLFIVAMSNPVEDLRGKPRSPQAHNDSAQWDSVAAKLQEAGIILHVIAKPVERLTRVFELYRRTMRSQARHEVIPWRPMDPSQCMCHLSGSTREASGQASLPSATAESDAILWPEIILDDTEPPDPTSHLRSQLQRNLSFPPDSYLATRQGLEPSDEIAPSLDAGMSSGSLSLVSRMQAIHGLAKRRPERSRPSRSSFFREGSPRRERAASHTKDRLRYLSVTPINTRQAPRSPPSTVTDSLESVLGVHGSRPAKTSKFDLQGAPSVSSQRGFQLPSPDSDSSATSTPSPLWPRQNLEKSPWQLASEVEINNVPTKATHAARPSPNSFTPSMLPLVESDMYDDNQTGSFFQPESPAAAVSASPILQSPVEGRLPSYGSYDSIADRYNSSRRFYDQYAQSSPTGYTLEDPSEQEVVPASLPPDANGQVPFVFDSDYEARSAFRLQRAMQDLRDTSWQDSVGEHESVPLTSVLPPAFAVQDRVTLGLRATAQLSAPSTAGDLTRPYTLMSSTRK